MYTFSPVTTDTRIETMLPERSYSIMAWSVWYVFGHIQTHIFLILLYDIHMLP